MISLCYFFFCQWAYVISRLSSLSSVAARFIINPVWFKQTRRLWWYTGLNQEESKRSALWQITSTSGRIHRSHACTHRNTPSCRILDILTPWSGWTKSWWSRFQSDTSVCLSVCLSDCRHTSQDGDGDGDEGRDRRSHPALCFFSLIYITRPHDDIMQMSPHTLLQQDWYWWKVCVCVCLPCVFWFMRMKMFWSGYRIYTRFSY